MYTGNYESPNAGNFRFLRIQKVDTTLQEDL